MVMTRTMKSLAKRVLPTAVQQSLITTRSATRTRWSLASHQVRNARRAFGRAANGSVWLPEESLSELQMRCPPRPKYGYDPETLEVRGRERAAEISSLPLGTDRIADALELGCMDGMTSRALREKGWSLTAIDKTSRMFDDRAVRSGVRCVQADAGCLGLRDDSFDIAFSYNAFEHFNDPDSVLEEMTRVVRPGGHIFLSFGPLYMSPWGQHAYASIRVPYCQFLFQREMMEKFVTTLGLLEIDFEQCNRWRVADFRSLWRRHSTNLKSIIYVERYELGHIDFIERFPECFKGKVNRFEELIVSSIFAVFRKRGSAWSKTASLRPA